MNGSMHFERTFNKSRRNNALSPKTIRAIHYEEKYNYMLMRAATLPSFVHDREKCSDSCHSSWKRARVSWKVFNEETFVVMVVTDAGC